ncbi:MAG TPA: tetratricopeptide repeat protein [Chitinophagaceae bacterium]|nr:tetratricopeptide repeat protein [Chitinophagaceae bacterium]
MLTLICGTLSCFAQITKIREAREYLDAQNYKKAILVINEAVANCETKNNAEAWFVRGMAYLHKALDTSVHAPEAAEESYNSLMKALTIKPDYSSDINIALYSHALITFNLGVASYGNKDFSAAYNQFMKVATIYNNGDGKRFINDNKFTELLTNAKTNAAYAALAGKRDKDALTLFIELKNTGSKDPTIYQSIIEIYQRQNNDAAALENINAARSLFPNDPMFRNFEINYYMKSGKQDVLLSKLEAAVKSDPGNPELLFNLGNAYENAAFPKDATGIAMARPANFSDLFSKAETTYQNAIAASPSNADYRYNFGVLYYESAVEIVKQMNNIKGTTAEDNKKYDALLAERTVLFAKALPHFESAYSLLDKRNSQLTIEEKVTYRNAMIGLREIYSRNNNKLKTDELNVKLDALKN